MTEMSDITPQMLYGQRVARVYAGAAHSAAILGADNLMSRNIELKMSN